MLKQRKFLLLKTERLMFSCASEWANGKMYGQLNCRDKRLNNRQR